LAPSSQSQLMYKDLLVRRMRANDIPDIMPIESVSFGSHHWSIDSFRSELKNQISRYYALIDTRDNRLIGYSGFWIILDESHVTTIAVDPSLRGQGLSEVLLIRMLDDMAGQSVKWVTLEVRASNFSAQQLYYKYHFRSMGTRPRYYQNNNEDALIMTTENINGSDFRTVLATNRQKLKDRLGGKLPEGIDS
jgi:ribosomal-protein-alanine N-acetyltransferase